MRYIENVCRTNENELDESKRSERESRVYCVDAAESYKS